MSNLFQFLRIKEMQILLMLPHIRFNGKQSDFQHALFHIFSSKIWASKWRNLRKPQYSCIDLRLHDSYLRLISEEGWGGLGFGQVKKWSLATDTRYHARESLEQDNVLNLRDHLKKRDWSKVMARGSHLRI